MTCKKTVQANHGGSVKLKRGIGVLFGLCLLLAPALLKGQNTYALSGRVNVAARQGDIYVFLVTEETFKKNRFSGIDTLVFPIYQDRVYVDFRFENLAPGTYGISCFQDTNRNGRFGHFLFTPFEPWAFSFNNQIKYPPRFNDISFNLSYDLRVNLVLGN